MNSDIRICISLPRHWKYRKLKRIVDNAMEYLVTFWGTVAEQIPNGALNGWSTDDVEDAAGWDEQPGYFCQALIDCGFLDVTEKGFTPHDWAEHQPWAIGAKDRSEAARKAGLASVESRKNKQRSVNEPLNGALNEPLTEGSTDFQRKLNPKNGSSTPSPSPSPNRKEKPLPSEAYQLSDNLAELILRNNPNNIQARKENTVKAWASDIDKLNRIDGQSWERIGEIIVWCQNDNFWSKNILSGSTLRKQFDKLSTKALSPPRKSTDDIDTYRQTDADLRAKGLID